MKQVGEAFPPPGRWREVGSRLRGPAQLHSEGGRGAQGRPGPAQSQCSDFPLHSQRNTCNGLFRHPQIYLFIRLRIYIFYFCAVLPSGVAARNRDTSGPNTHTPFLSGCSNSQPRYCSAFSKKHFKNPLSSTRFCRPDAPRVERLGISFLLFFSPLYKRPWGSPPGSRQRAARRAAGGRRSGMGGGALRGEEVQL